MVEVPAGMKLPHTPKAMRTSLFLVTCRIRPGAETAIQIYPMPSMKRLPNSNAAVGAKEPMKLPKALQVRPKDIIRRYPNQSEIAPTAGAVKAPRMLVADSTHPAMTRLMPKSVRRSGRTGGAFPTWNAATTPAPKKRNTRPQSVEVVASPSGFSFSSIGSVSLCQSSFNHSLLGQESDLHTRLISYCLQLRADFLLLYRGLGCDFSYCRPRRNRGSREIWEIWEAKKGWLAGNHPFALEGECMGRV